MVAVKAMARTTETVVIAIVMVGAIADSQTGVVITDGSIPELKDIAMIQTLIVSIAGTRSVATIIIDRNECQQQTVGHTTQLGLKINRVVDEAVALIEEHHPPGIGNRRVKLSATATTNTFLPMTMEL